MIAQILAYGMHLGLHLMMSDPRVALRTRHPPQIVTSLTRTSKPEMAFCGLPAPTLHGRRMRPLGKRSDKLP